MSIMREIYMKTHSKKQLTCTERESKSQSNVWTATKAALIWVIKTLLRALLLRPSTWKWVMVKLPELIEKLELFVKDGFSALMDLLS